MIHFRFTFLLIIGSLGLIAQNAAIQTLVPDSTFSIQNKLLTRGAQRDIVFTDNIEKLKIELSNSIPLNLNFLSKKIKS